MPILRSPALPAQTAAGADSTTLMDTFEVSDASGVVVSRVEIVPPAGYTTVTGANTNNVQFTVRQLRAGSVVQANVAQLVLNAGTNLVAETPVNVPIVNAVTFQQDDVLDCVMHQNGTGVAVGAGLFCVVDIA